MSDFSDFLKRSYAYVAIGDLKPGKFAALQQLYEAAIGTYQEGFKGAYLLREPGTERGISVVLWESMADLEASESPGYQALLQKMMPLFAEGPTATVYELAGEYLPPTADDSDAS